MSLLVIAGLEICNLLEFKVRGETSANSDIFTSFLKRKSDFEVV